MIYSFQRDIYEWSAQNSVKIVNDNWQQIDMLSDKYPRYQQYEMICVKKQMILSVNFVIKMYQGWLINVYYDHVEFNNEEKLIKARCGHFNKIKRFAKYKRAVVLLCYKQAYNFKTITTDSNIFNIGIYKQNFCMPFLNQLIT